MGENHNFIDMTGGKYGKLTVLSMHPERDKKRRIHWLCRCDCGTEKVILGHRLRQGHTTSCGCANAARKRAGFNRLSPEEQLRRRTEPRECSRCHGFFPPSEFGRRIVRHWCRQCRSEHSMTWAKRKTAYGAANRHGLTVEEYAAIKLAHNNQCDLCGIEILTSDVTCIDHDHRFPKRDKRGIRGTLCNGCNSGIGMFLERPHVLRNTADYLEKHKIRLDKLLKV